MTHTDEFMSEDGLLPKGPIRNAADNARNALVHAVDWTKEHAADLRLQTKRRIRRGRVGFWQTMEENPLLVGASSLALGLIAGLALPSTRREDALMGDTRDHLLDQVKEAGQQAIDKGKQMAETLADTVREEVLASSRAD